MAFQAEEPQRGASYSTQATEAALGGSSVMRWCSAAVSMALIIGLGVWSYKLVARDVNGIYVVRALDGPMRVSPEDPGGMVTAHQGLSVTEVAADGAAGEVAEEVALASDTPELSEEDQPATILRAEQPTAEAADAALVDPDTVTTTNLPDDVDPNDPVAVALALAEQLSDGVEPLEPLSGDDTAAAAATDPKIEIKVIPASVPGVRRSLRPTLRPAGLRPAQTAPAVQDATDLRADITPAADAAQNGQLASVPVGTRLVQLGAFDTPVDASSAWAVLTARFDVLMDGKSHVIQEARSGGRTFYRLRAVGFADLSDARQFCAALVSEKADCIPVVAR